MLQSLAEIGTSEAQAKYAADQNIAIAKRAQDHQKVEGEAAVSLIEKAGDIGKAGPTGDHTGKLVNTYS